MLRQSGIDIAWTIDFIFGGHIIGLAAYMCDSKLPLYLRGVSLFHIALPVSRLGYDKRALVYQTLLTLGGPDRHLCGDRPGKEHQLGLWPWQSATAPAAAIAISWPRNGDHPGIRVSTNSSTAEAPILSVCAVCDQGGLNAKFCTCDDWPCGMIREGARVRFDPGIAAGTQSQVDLLPPGHFFEDAKELMRSRGIV
jgi:hypothetical protein